MWSIQRQIGKSRRGIDRWQCDTAHSVAYVLARNLGELDDRDATVRVLVDVVLPRLDEHVPQSTIER
ncbi:Bacteriophage protein [Mycobacteroides abscessus]|uniref:Bacteriophage protein n=3 Tax=Mycobacteroides abscessus TaxID=36809 RepID=A0A829HYQ8_9MYCO|nr:hypothetical protein MYCMA_12830 [Mycobacteroides abscessus subsp. massiliense str. GO 06]AMU24542.1 hypothetical protein A3N96_03200 [Mycobacteroides abscessus]EHB96823.1 hypothetical protein MAB47J26_23631 [Mycobacteroides abscessus 47J26]EIU58793.1 hypothetical protein MM1S1510930_5487 [Mycobacteroides abscessus subsp. bolletii 1S-151-0930]EIU72941.1 hypothetical protein MM1S1520914_0708 [Mycobacteroides abscessus subsp. bolletii 1S-152-0914]EIU82504.1 hypothetical protein MM1S1530915_00